MATAYITLMMVVAHYFFDHDHAKNPLDRKIIDSLAWLWKSPASDSESDNPSSRLKWTEAIETAVLMFSGQQLVTGIGILVSGYSQVHCSLLIYHWQIVVYLAWFSSPTHLTTLTAMRMFFREQPTLAYWRIFLMGCTIVLLAVSLMPTGYILENSITQFPLATPLANPVLAVPASCLFSSSDFQEAYGSFLDESSPEAAEALEPFNWIFILASLLFLVVSYISRVVSLFTPTANFTQFALRTLPGYKVKKLLSYILKKSNTSEPSIFRKIWAAVALLIMTIYVLLKVIFDIGQSMLWEVSRTFALLRLFELTAHKDFLAFSSPSLRYNSTPHNMVFRGSVRTKYLGIWTGHGFAVDCTSIFFVGRATV